MEKLPRKFKPNNGTFKLVQHYIGKAKEKKLQLEEIANEYKCDKKLVVMVLNDENIFPSLTYSEYLEILKKISNTLAWGDNCHFAIFTGVLDLFNDIVNNPIYPPI